MRTQDLIESLVSDHRAARRHWVAKAIAGAMLGSGAATVFLVAATLGVRPDLVQAAGTTGFWIKLGYPLAMAAAATCLLAPLARPAGAKAWPGALLSGIVAIVVFLAVVELSGPPGEQRLTLLMGTTWRRCFLVILLFALPNILLVSAAVRALAPTRLRLAGFAIGLLAGSLAATGYALFCTEQTATFLAVWYTAAILAAGGIGALFGPIALRW